MESNTGPKPIKAVIYIEKQLWNELQGALRTEGSTASRWVRESARKYLEDHKPSNK